MTVAKVCMYVHMYVCMFAMYVCVCIYVCILCTYVCDLCTCVGLRMCMSTALSSEIPL